MVNFDSMRAGDLSQIRVGRRSLDGPVPFRGVEVVSTAILGSATTAFTSFSANPGQAASFPLLSKEAAIFEKYRFTRLRYHYLTKVNQFVANGVGTVVMSFDYDAADPPPSSLQSALNTRPNAMGAPYQDFSTEDIAPGAAKGREWYYLRPGNVPGGTDIKEYDMGVLNVTVDSNVNTNAIGMLFCEYEGFFSTKVQEGTGSPVNNQVSWFQSTGAQTVTTATPASLLLATATTNGLSIVNTAGSFVPPAGNYLVSGWCNVADSAAEALTAVLDVKKNAASVYTVGAPEFKTGVSLGAGEVVNVPVNAFVTANGTDAFTIVLTATGAAGTLTANGSVTWVAA